MEFPFNFNLPIYCFSTFCVIFTSILCLSYCDDDLEVVVTLSKQYTTQNFAMEVAKNNHFIMFYAPWCAHCKRLHPTWEELAEMLNDEGSRVTIAKVDCTVDTSVCTEQDVTGYPTLKYFGLDKPEPVRFRGTRDLPTLTNFLNEQLGSSLVKPGSEGIFEEKSRSPIEITDEMYVSHLSKGNHFVKFYAPWCGHCQKLSPIWESVGAAFAVDKTVTIGKVDCTVNRDACKEYDIKSYPTLLWIENGQKIDKFQGQRTLEDLKAYVLERLGGSSVKSVLDDEVAPPEPNIVALNNDNFQEGISKGLTFVKFYAPWCGHCKGLAPIWRDLGKKYSSRKEITIADVDCTVEENKQLCNEQEVDGFPTLLLYKDGERIDEYTGARSLSDLSDFVGKHLSTLDGDHDEL